MAQIIGEDYHFENALMMLIGKEFGGQASGFSIKWEAKNFKRNKINDPFLAGLKDQMQGRAPKIAEIYFRGKYLCDVSEAMKPDEVIKLITERLTLLFTKGGVRE